MLALAITVTATGCAGRDAGSTYQPRSSTAAVTTTPAPTGTSAAPVTVTAGDSDTTKQTTPDQTEAATQAKTAAVTAAPTTTTAKTTAKTVEKITAKPVTTEATTTAPSKTAAATFAQTAVVTQAKAATAAAAYTAYNNKALLTKNMSAAKLKVFNQIVTGLRAHKTVIDITDNVLKVNDASDLMQLVQYYECESLFTAQGFSSTVSGGYVKTIKVTYTKTAAAVSTEKNKLAAKIDAIVAAAPAGMNDFQKVKYIHDKIIKNCVYSDTGSNAYSAYGCLVEGKAVCQGYSEAFMLLCGELGIPCVLITGTDKEDGTNHMWDMVKVSGAWYHIDVTWDDPYKAAAEKSYVRYDYFNVTDATIKIDHKITANPYYTYPAATATAGNYYNYYGYTVSTTANAKSVITAQLKKAAETDAQFIRIRCASAATYKTISSYLFAGDKAIFTILKDTKKSTGADFDANSYTKFVSDDHYTITIKLTY
ncbi:MAG: transglutaminase domain-containing protein [Oscillospiraceae bacterium]